MFRERRIHHKPQITATKSVALAVVFCSLGLAAANIYLSGQVSHLGGVLNTLELKTTDLSKQSSEIQLKLYQATSLTLLKDKAPELGLTSNVVLKPVVTSAKVTLNQ